MFTVIVWTISHLRFLFYTLRIKLKKKSANTSHRETVKTSVRALLIHSTLLNTLSYLLLKPSGVMTNRQSPLGLVKPF